jgi:hypothetical protein
MASQQEVAREANARFWITSMYKPGVSLSKNDSADRVMAGRWLTIYRDLQRQNAAGTLSLLHKHPQLAARLADAIREYQIESRTNPNDWRHREAMLAKNQALDEAGLWHTMLTSPSHERIAGYIDGPPYTERPSIRAAERQKEMY